MLEIIYYKREVLFKIIIIILINLLIIGILTISQYKKFILNNWEIYRKKWYIIPISGFIKKNKNQSILNTIFSNFISFLIITIKPIFNLLIKPIFQCLQIFSRIFNIIRNSLQNFRKQFSIMRQFLYTMVNKIMKRLENSISATLFFFLKLRESLKRQFAIYNLLSKTILHSSYYLSSLINGPVVKMGVYGEKIGSSMASFTLGIPGIILWNSSLCFDPSTIVKLHNNINISIKNLKPGDKLLDGSIVEVVCEFNIEQIDVKMFNYKNIIVSSHHIVLENNKYIRVKKSIYAKKILYKKNILICLITNTGNIKINNIIFKDYLDTHDIGVNNQINKKIEKFLNKGNFNNYNNNSSDLISGFNENTVVNNKKLRDLKIGELFSNNKIIGIIKINKSFITPYKYSFNKNNILVSANCLVFENNKWIRVCNSKYGSYIPKKNNNNYINFITINNILHFNNILFRDFVETSNYHLNNSIDDIVNDYYNKI